MGQRTRSLLGNVALAAGALAAAAGIGEALLRGCPALLPHGVYSHTRLDPEHGLNVHGGDVLYNKGWRLRKKPNQRGFLDVEHAEAKPPGTIRLGVFGDSYVEAQMLPLDQTFFRRLPATLGGAPLEPLAFGLSGWGTLHEYLVYRALAPRYDLDAVVALFVENDPGDNLLSVSGGRRRSRVPYAVASRDGAGYEIVYVGSQRPSLGFRFARGLQQRSLLAQVVYRRWRLLGSAGPGPGTPSPEGSRARPGARPHHLDLPTRWPAAPRADAEQVVRALLGQWSRDAARRGERFAVLYVPRGRAQLAGELELGDTWRPWLGRTCRELGLTLLDPSEALGRAQRQGTPVYDDHWTAAGHDLVAELLAAQLRRWFAPAEEAGRGRYRGETPVAAGAEAPDAPDRRRESDS